MSQRTNSYPLWLGAICALGLALRLYGLTANGLWFDEICSVLYSRGPISDVAFISFDTNPPLYYVFLHFWMLLAGSSEASVRFLSVMLGIGCVIATAHLGSRLFNPVTGLLAAFWMSVMVFPLHYSQEARTFSLFLLLHLLSYNFLLDVFSRDEWKYRIGYVLCTAAMCYAHNYWVFTLIAQNLFALFVLSKDRRRLFHWIGLQAVVALLFLPYALSFFIKAREVVQNGFWIPQPVPSDLLKTFRSFVSYLVAPQFVWLFLALAAIGLVTRNSSDRSQRPLLSDKQRKFLLLCWLLTPVVAPLIASQFMTPIYLIRYTIGALPAFYLLLSAGILNLPGKPLRVAAVAFIAVLCAFSLRNYYTEPADKTEERSSQYFIFPRQLWRDFIPSFVQNVRSGDAVAISPPWYARIFDYYPMQPSPVRFAASAKEKPEISIQKLKEELSADQRLWLLFCFPLTPEEQATVQLLTEHYGAQEIKQSILPTESARLFLVDFQRSSSAAGKAETKR